jgi:two-component system, NtrC family, sensor histidine kinase PilS
MTTPPLDRANSREETSTAGVSRTFDRATDHDSRELYLSALPSIVETNLRSNLKLLMYLRVAIAMTLLLSGVVLHFSGQFILLPQTVLIDATIALSYTLLFSLLLGQVKNLRALAFYQIFCDVALISIIIFQSGAAESVFTFLFVITIIAAGVLLEQDGLYLITSTCSTFLGVVVLLHMNQVLPGYTPVIISFGGVLSDYLTNVLAFFGTAMLVHILSNQLRGSWEELAAEKATLEELRTLHEDVLLSIGSGILTTDDRLCVTFYNEAAQRILGFSADDFRDKRLEDLFGDSFAEAAKGVLQDEYAGICFKDFWVQAKTEDWVYLDFSTSRLIDQEGNLKGLLVIFLDKTDFKRLEMQIHRQDELATVGRMAAGIAHEIRNPLGAIYGSIQLLNREIKFDDTNQNLIDIIVREINRLNKLVEDFLDFARHQEAAIHSTDICHLIRDVKALLSKKLEAEAKRIRIEAVFHDEPFMLLVDPERMKQVFWNLALNACQAMGERGTLTITTGITGEILDSENLTSEGDYLLLAPPGEEFARISFSDTGVGIPRAQLKEVFKPFQSKRAGGVGLGLAMAKKIVESHKGVIHVHSVLNRGTTFSVFLPLIGPQWEGPPQKNASQQESV